MKVLRKQYEDLANAVVATAADDWRRAVKRLKKDPESGHAKAMKDECEKFLTSGYIGRFTSVDGNLILRMLEREVAK
jgi:hypothetical protein